MFNFLSIVCYSSFTKYIELFKDDFLLYRPSYFCLMLQFAFSITSFILFILFYLIILIQIIAFISLYLEN